jgi:hypothetical protein
MKSYRMIATFLTATVALFALSACGGSGGVSSTMPGAASNSLSQPLGTAAADTDTSVDNDPEDNTSILDRLDDMKTIGSTVDPLNGDQNPYGLDIAKIDAGKLKRGDLVVCNFNNSANIQGTGTTIIALHPNVGSAPIHIAKDSSLNGCTEVALGSADDIWASAFSANDNPIVGPDGTLFTTLAGGRGTVHSDKPLRTMRGPSAWPHFMKATPGMEVSCGSTSVPAGRSPLTSSQPAFL